MLGVCLGNPVFKMSLQCLDLPIPDEPGQSLQRLQPGDVGKFRRYTVALFPQETQEGREKTDLGVDPRYRIAGTQAMIDVIQEILAFKVFKTPDTAAFTQMP